MAKLNETKIGKLRWDNSKRTRGGKVPQFQWMDDAEVGGLHLRIYPPKAYGISNKVFYLKYGSSVERKVYRIGTWGEWTLADARDEARRLRRAFYDLGVDPNRAKKERLRKAQACLTVKELCELYLEDRAPAWSDSYTASNRLHASRVVDALGAKYADSLTKDDVAPVFLDIKRKSPSQADLFKTFGRGCYRWGMDWKGLSGMPNPFVLERGNSSAKSKFKIHRIQRKRALRYKKGECGQLFDLLADFDKHSRSDGQEYLTIAKLFLLTAFRNEELRKARWEHLDHKLRTLRNADPKYGEIKAYTMPLTDMGYELLESLGEGNIRFRHGPIFPGQARDKNNNPKPLGSFERWTRLIRKDPRMPVDESCMNEAGQGGHIRIHDLRRSSITWLQQMGFTVEERGIFKGAKPSGVTEAVYSQADQEDIRLRCAQAIEDRIRDVENGDETSMFDTWKASKKVTDSPLWPRPRGSRTGGPGGSGTLTRTKGKRTWNTSKRATDSWRR